MFNNLLDYWHALEFFSPCWPVKPKEDLDLKTEPLPWPSKDANPRIRFSYDVYLGKISVESLIKWLLDALKCTEKDDAVEKDTSLTCLLALKVDESGKYVPGSFTISSLVWAVCQLVSATSLDCVLNHHGLDELQEKINDRLVKEQEDHEEFTITKDILSRLFCGVCGSIQLPAISFPYCAWSRAKRDYANKQGEFPPINPATELMQSFYLNDLEKVQHAPTEKIQQYVTGRLNPDLFKDRIHIDRDAAEMRNCLTADKFPLGAWPSAYSPSLMQQLGINLAISNEQKIFSVNGPPGTGKTTLLKEIVASNVIQRAILLSKFDKPDDALQKETFANPIDEFNRTYYRLDCKVSAFGMIVASNNNAAVENISIELPKMIAKDRTGRFTSANVNSSDSTYFADIASALLGEPAWGLISARLGKKSNLSKLKDRLWWAKDGATLKGYYDNQSKPDWQEACDSFAVALDAVMTARKQIQNVQAALAEMKEAEAFLRSAQAAEANAKTQYTQQAKLLDDETQSLRQLEGELLGAQANIDQLKASISFCKWIFRKLLKKDQMISQWEDRRTELAHLEAETDHRHRSCNDVQNAKNAAEKDWQASVANVQNAEKRVEFAQKNIQAHRMHLKGNWADDDFWNNILENEASQSACPWVTPEYDKLREELFYQALMLHKAFILSSYGVKQNLMRLFNVWEGKIIGADRNAAYGHLLNTLLLVVPVVSTTFASVQSFLCGINPEELGILIVDEAGQATPQSVLGAMLRTRKVIIVGDPLQVEPVVTVPKELRKRFADKYNIPADYRLPEISVQMLADSINKYGGTRTLGGETLWLGCPLVVHRRCLDPMFSISNEVAYNNRMFFKTAPSKPGTPFLLQKSIWFDCRGKEKGNKNHAVSEQVDLAEELFKKSVDVYCGLPDLYFITPFTSVAYALTKALRGAIKRMLNVDEKEALDWIEQHCGTVHTFQGKEAAEVLFVLGCDTQSGLSAAQWVGQKPNIVNVAVSRAKYRLGVIGDYALWKDIAYVRNICNHLEKTSDFYSALG